MLAKSEPPSPETNPIDLRGLSLPNHSRWENFMAIENHMSKRTYLYVHF